MPVARTPMATRRSARTRSRSRSRGRSKSPAPSTKKSEGTMSSAKKKEKKKTVPTGQNWVAGGLGDGTWMVPFLLVFAPTFVQVLGYLTSEAAVNDGIDPKAGLSGLLGHCYNADSYTSMTYLEGVTQGFPAYFVCFFGSVWEVVKSSYVAPTWEAAQFLLAFNAVALVLDVGLPGKVETGPETLTGHVPKYVNNSLLHCAIFTLLFFAGSASYGPYFGLSAEEGSIGAMVWPVDWRYDFGIMFKVFPASITCLNIFGMLLAVFLYFKGLYFPSTADSGTTGSLLKDFCWGTELYPKVFGVDIKRFINCRFSMTYWMLAGLSFSHHAHSLREDGQPFDWGLFLAGVSQFLYLVKFFEWEIGYMRSIDIIVDRAGWEIQWGCLVWVPSVYTLHSRFCVLHPSGLGPLCAGSIFGLGMLGVLLNYWADVQRKNFREANGECLIWGKNPVYVEAQYQVIDPKSGKATKRSSLLLASGFWGIARHFHYVFELTAAYSWCFLANPLQNGFLPLFYCLFLTILLAERAKRDESKCQKKYGKYYTEYSKKVPYLIVPGLY